MESSNLYQNDDTGNVPESAGIYLNEDFNAAASNDPIYGNIGAGEDLNNTPNQHLPAASEKVETRPKPNRQKNPRNPVKSRHDEDMYSLADNPKGSSRVSVAFNVPRFNKTKDNDSSSEGGFCSDMLHFGSKKFYMLLAFICICVLGGVIIAVFVGISNDPKKEPEEEYEVTIQEEEYEITTNFNNYRNNFEDYEKEKKKKLIDNVRNVVLPIVRKVNDLVVFERPEENSGKKKNLISLLTDTFKGVNCVWSTWSTWSQCSNSEQTRRRSPKLENARECKGRWEEKTSCFSERLSACSCNENIAVTFPDGHGGSKNFAACGVKYEISNPQRINGLICYVNKPSSCTDLVPFGSEHISWEACRSYRRHH